MVEARAGNRWRILLTGADSAGRFTLIEHRVLAGTEPPRHVHAREDEIIYVLEGRIAVERGGKEHDCPAGTCLSLPRGVEHSFSVVAEEARLLTLLTPAGLEGYYQELDAFDDDTRELQPLERLVVIAARYGIAITGLARRDDTCHGNEWTNSNV